MSCGADSRRAMNAETDVTPAETSGSPVWSAIRTRTSSPPTMGARQGRVGRRPLPAPVLGSAERDEEGVTLVVYFMPAVLGEDGSKQPAVIRQRFAVALPEPFEKPRGTVYVCKQKRDRSAGKSPIAACRRAQMLAEPSKMNKAWFLHSSAALTSSRGRNGVGLPPELIR